MHGLNLLIQRFAFPLPHRLILIIDGQTAWLVSFGITCKCFLASLAYSIIIGNYNYVRNRLIYLTYYYVTYTGDSFTALAKTFQLPSLIAQRSNVIMLVTTFALLPLCSMRTLNALAPFSLLGLIGTLYTAVFMTIRLLDKSYLPGGQFFETLALTSRPIFGSRGPVKINHLLFVLISMLSTSFIAHYNAPRFLTELKNPTMKRYNTVVNLAFISSILTYLYIMVVGFLSFGGNSLGFVLNNYSGLDKLATVARMAIGGAILSGYPFVFFSLRDGLFDLAGASAETRAKAIAPLTVGLLGLITSLALVLKNVGFVVSLSGAMFGSALMFIAPALMNIKNIKAIAKSENKEISGGHKFEIINNYGIVGMGVVMTIIGVTVSILKEMKKL